jgi:hypothetical protein
VTFQRAKAVVLALDALESQGPDSIARGLSSQVTADWVWRGMHPFGVLSGPEAVATTLWQPFLTAMTSVHRRTDIFFAGLNEIDGFQSTWVVSIGHLVGLFDQPWLGIRPTGRMAFLRFAEFHRVEGDLIAETAFFCDIPHLMTQAGQNPFPPQTAAHLVQPGPLGHGGLLMSAQPQDEGDATLALINRMITDLGTWKGGLPLRDELARTWAPDMIWWGPAGIGATMTIDRYAAQHAAPFRAAFTDRTGTGHLARLAEGHFGGFFGWPNFTARHKGGFMGLPASAGPVEFRVVDIYRRDGDRLAENWVFIDLLHFCAQQGVDVLARNASITG